MMIFSLCHVFFYFFALITDEGILSGDFIKNGGDVLELLVECSLRTVVHKRQCPTFIHVIRLVTIGTLMSQEVFVTKCEINYLKALLGLEGNLLLSNSVFFLFGALGGVAWCCVESEQDKCFYIVINSTFLALQFFQGTKTACEDDSGFLGRLKKVFYPEEEEVDDNKDKRHQGKA